MDGYETNGAVVRVTYTRSRVVSPGWPFLQHLWLGVVHLLIDVQQACSGQTFSEVRLDHAGLRVRPQALERSSGSLLWCANSFTNDDGCLSQQVQPEIDNITYYNNFKYNLNHYPVVQ